MKQHTCDKCKYYSVDSPPTSEYANSGACALIGDANDGPNAIDKCVGWNYEGYRAGVYVGPKFGCIHWEKKILIKE